MKAPKQSQTRQEVYTYIGNVIGRNLTPDEHNAIRAILRAYLASCEEYGAFIEANQRKPLEHVLICGVCKKTEKAVGYNAYKGKRRGFVAP